MAFDGQPIKTPNPVDVHFGGRICMRRKFAGFSQTDLAKSFGLTFQQVQKNMNVAPTA